MPETELNALSDMNVLRVALVDKAANREPFRILKRETPMSIDLGKIFKRDPLKPGVAFVAVAKSANMAAVEAVLKANGFPTEHKEEQDAGVLFFKSDEKIAPEDVVAMQVTDTVAFGLEHVGIMKGFQAYNWQTTDFKELVAQEGAIPLVKTAHELLGHLIFNIMEEADTPSELGEMVQKAASDFGAYAATIFSNVPEHAFKMEEGFRALEAAPETSDESKVEKAEDAQTSKTEDPGDPAKVEKAEGTPDDADDATAEDGTPEAVEKSETSDKDGKDAVKKTEDVDGDAPKLTSGPSLDALKALFESELKPFAEQLSLISKGVETVQGEVTTLKSRVSKAEKAVNGTVVTEDQDDEPEVVSKSEARNGRLLADFDTAFQPSIRDELD